jgi:hypothetical protein
MEKMREALIERVKEEAKGDKEFEELIKKEKIGKAVASAVGVEGLGGGGDGEDDKKKKGAETPSERVTELLEKIREEERFGTLVTKDADARGQVEGSLGFVGNMIRGVGSVSYREEVFREMVRMGKEEEEKGGKWKVYGKGKYKHVTLEGTRKSPGEYKDSQVGGIIGVTRRLGEGERGFVIGAFVGIDGHGMTQKKKVYKKEEKEKEKGEEAVTPTAPPAATPAEPAAAAPAEEGTKELEGNIMRLKDSKGKITSVVLGMCGGYIDPNFEIRMLLRGRINKYEVERLGNKVFKEEVEKLKDYN